MMNELAEGRADIDGLLQKTDNLIREIKHSDIDMVQEHCMLMMDCDYFKYSFLGFVNLSGPTRRLRERETFQPRITAYM